MANLSSRQQGARHSWDAVLGTAIEDLAFTYPADILQGRGEEVYARQVNRRCLTKLPSTFATECRQARHPTSGCSAVRTSVPYMSRTVRCPQAISGLTLHSICCTSVVCANTNRKSSFKYMQIATNSTGKHLR